MRAYTPWRIEEVGKLHHSKQIRIMTESKVRTNDILLEVLDVLSDRDTHQHFDQGPKCATDFPNKSPKRPDRLSKQQAAPTRKGLAPHVRF